jgi:hypothetical protein
MNDDSPTITQQYSFAVGDDGETDGAIEPAEESVETSLETWGADVDHRERDTRIDQPEASSFGVDDRASVTRGDGGEQHALFADTDDDQQTLTGERAASQCLFESDEQDDRDDEPTEATDEITDASDEPTPRAVATDGGEPVEDNPNEQDDHDDEADTASDEPDESPEENEDTTFDPDAETVTEAWEGAFITASWGYEQTNAELAQIVEVSDSGKTVLARMVVAERVGHGRNNTQLRPTADQYGDEFRLHVRSVRSDPAFRGSYPLSNDGDMDDGPTRIESFSPFDNDPENSVRRTAINHGH